MANPRFRIAAALLTLALAFGACSSGDDLDGAHLPTVSTTAVSSGATASTGPANELDPEPTELDADPGQETATLDPFSGELTMTVVATLPHDPNAFTQGLEVHDGQLIESTGLYGESDRRLVEIGSGEVHRIEALDGSLFGEGLTVVGDEILQLTWKAGVYIRSDVETLTETGRGVYEGEGWGLCFDGNQLVMSDGTASLTFRNPETFERTGTIDVTLNGEPLVALNELECVNGHVFANVLGKDSIVVIDPVSGQVVATLDASSLRPDDAPLDNSRFALNGIANDPATGHFFLTGKRWSVLYEVELS
jgi:glutamine cyclotransferase